MFFRFLICTSFLINLFQTQIARGPLLWSDEFNYEGQPDPNNWYPQIDFPNENPKLSSCFSSRNVHVTEGNLRLVIRKEPFNGKNYTSAALWSKRSFQYGIFEMRAKLGIGRGAWSNWWFLSDQRKGSKWPADGEIDVVEVINTTNYQYGRVHGSVHNDKFDNQIKNPSTFKSKEMTGSTTISNPSDDFHIYTLDWNSKRIDFYLRSSNNDDVKFYSYKNDATGKDSWPFDSSMTMIFNNKLGLPGDTFSGFLGIDDSIFPLYHDIDYIRHYALSDSTLNNNDINWEYINYGSNVTWAPGCDFPGNDLKYELTKIPVTNQCEYKCLNTTGCTHIVWYDGICFLKKGKVTTKDAIKSLDANKICAIINSK